MRLAHFKLIESDLRIQTKQKQKLKKRIWSIPIIIQKNEMKRIKRETK